MDTSKSTVVEVLLIEIGGDAALAPLLEHRSVAMLPVGGKPVIQLWCEQLKLAGVQRLHLILREFPEQVREFVGDGARWGLEIGISSAPGHMDTGEVLRLGRSHISSRCMVASVANLPLTGLRDWLQAASHETVGIVSTGTGTDLRCELTIVEPEELKRIAGPEKAIRLAPPAPCLYPIHTARDLWQANMDLLDGKISDPAPPGFEHRDGVLLDVGARLQDGIKLTPPCRIGRHSLVRSQIKLGPGVVVGENCYIDEASQLSESVVFDNTFLGSHTELHRVLADGRLVYQVDHDVATWIDDPLIIGSTSSPSKAVGVGQRVVATLLLLGLFPLLGLRAVGKALSGKSVWQQETIFIPAGQDLTGAYQYSELALYSFTCKNPRWRKLPWLWSVIKGDLDLYGVTPRYEADPAVPAWAREWIRERPGVITLADVTVGASKGVIDEGVIVTDSYYLATRSRKRDVMLLGRWLTGLFAKFSS